MLSHVLDLSHRHYQAINTLGPPVFCFLLRAYKQKLHGNAEFVDHDLSLQCTVRISLLLLILNWLSSSIRNIPSAFRVLRSLYSSVRMTRFVCGVVAQKFKTSCKAVPGVRKR